MPAHNRSIIRTFFLVAVALLFMSGASQAGDLTGRWGVGLEYSYMKLTEGYWDYSNIDQFATLAISRGLSSHWNVHANFKFGHIRPGAEYRGEDVGWSTKSGAPLYNAIFQPSVNLQYRFIPSSWASPWIGAGLGVSTWKVLDKTGESSVGLYPGGEAAYGYDTSGNNVQLKGTDFTISLEAGIDLFLTDHLALDLGARYHLMPGNKIDNAGMSFYWGPEHVDANTAGFEFMGGLSWWFGASDKDHDGIANKYDKCPDQAEDMDGYNDLDGCPDIDNDKDGILDVDDRCPNDPEDKDGFKDEDGCPDPDNDEDGIVDGRDQCPDEPEDIDGFEDEDGCPDPDNDGDGVLDGNDKCPDTPAGVEVDEFGCAIDNTPAAAAVIPAVVATLPPAPVLEGVRFSTGSADLLPESIDVLLETAFTLQEDPSQRVEIRGHTDSTGSAAGNLDLSQRRAQAVRAALIDMGIDSGRITAVGYGEEFPIATNETREGRAKNRRVELFKLN